MKTAALLFMLAVAASQVELVRSEVLVHEGVVDLNACRPYFYGVEYTEAQVLFPNDGSFSLCFTNTVSVLQECFLVSDVSGAILVDFSSPPVSEEVTPFLHNELPTLTETVECLAFFPLQNVDGWDMITIYLYKLGTQTALFIEITDNFAPTSLVVTTTIGETTLDSWDLDTNMDYYFYVDISGCRSAGLVVPPTIDDAACTSTCPVVDSGTNPEDIVTGCSSSEICMGNNECLPPTPVCTVIGSTVIDYFNTVHSVPDMCAYTLVGNEETEVSVAFQERHLEDVPYLTNVIVFMNVASKTINLGPGGVVWVGEEILELTSTPQTLHGVELSKDDTGVTLKTPLTNTVVHFDGDTAHVTGGDAGMSGLCGDPETDSETQLEVEDTVDSYNSASGCAASQSTDVASTTNCSASDDYCDLMSQASFEDCNHLAPLPFIAACKSNACKYAEEERPVDYLACQYLEAYAKACFLSTGTTLGDWRSPAGCSATRLASCLSQDCSDHEFCAGEPVCFCRASFNHPRDDFVSSAGLAVCTMGSMEVTLVECLLWENGIDPSTLNLNDEDCKGVSDPESHMMTFSAAGDTCGTEVTKNDGRVVYRNVVLMGAKPVASLVTREQLVEIDFSCSVGPPETQSVTFRIKDGSVFQTVEDEELSYSLTMSAYTDAGFASMVDSNTELELNQRIWLEVTTQDLDEDTVAVVTDSCWVTNDVDPTAAPAYDLVIDGCPNPADQTVEMVGNGVGVSNSFSFLVFAYTAENKSSEMYLHCNLVVSPKSTPPPSCGAARKRRSARPGYAQGGHASPRSGPIRGRHLLPF
ncbi:alpha-tectorin-like isoform X2 [Pseudoliparis swirei]|uniref:alpha-tectorin-like isoform X2 n=1 Tax=Pseudoliparis swirei TaxID=2059687 RepID=UPI0024BD9AA8|nr:alpha-tectorin-like isoform X2 [Pseudoliparis swirei]XP_056284179.1 alpha-tectorin-like isoform X2 [Pseudoliparis swirei]